jgi:murein DD-endopeptidase MepM/ murein hydrolase activator NlpD
MTLVDLALLSDIPAGTLAELEYGRRQLDPDHQARLARIFGIAADQLHTAARPRPPIDRAAIWARRGAMGCAAAILALMLALNSALGQRAAAAQSSAPTPAPQPTRGAAAAPSSTPPPTPTHPPATATPTSSPPTPTPAPRFTLAADGPHGCPLAPASGRVVLTQGYNEGTHMPTSIWGAVDLAIDGDGDGAGDPGATQGQPILSTLDGVARVYLGSWPAGNYVRVVNERAGWSTAYAHLDQVAVADGQALGAGDTLGTVGSTGMASGPHLHYEVWRGGTNVDPTDLIGCR